MDSSLARTAPYLRAAATTRSMMTDVLFALLPALIWGTYVFGWRALILCLVSSASAVAFETILQTLFRRRLTAGDASALVTGLILAMNLPVTVPLWIPVLGAFFAVGIVKFAFGGLGKNLVNPALAARGVLRLAFSGTLLRYAAPFTALPLFGEASAEWVKTPQEILKSGAIPEYSVYDLLSGTVPGAIGEVSALLLLAGGLYLLIRRTVTWQIPAAFLGSLFLLSYFFPAVGDGATYASLQLLTGGTVLIAFFSATDVVTSPFSGTGKFLFGLGCGAITFLFRRSSLPVEGAVCAVLIMDLAAPLLDLIRRLPAVIRARYR